MTRRGEYSVNTFAFAAVQVQALKVDVNKKSLQCAKSTQDASTLDPLSWCLSSVKRASQQGCGVVVAVQEPATRRCHDVPDKLPVRVLGTEYVDGA